MPRATRTKPIPRPKRNRGAQNVRTHQAEGPRPPEDPKDRDYAEDGEAAEENAPPEADGLTVGQAQVGGDARGKHGEGARAEEREDAGSVGEAQAYGVDHSR